MPKPGAQAHDWHATKDKAGVGAPRTETQPVGCSVAAQALGSLWSLNSSRSFSFWILPVAV